VLVEERLCTPYHHVRCDRPARNGEAGTTNAPVNGPALRPPTRIKVGGRRPNCRFRVGSKRCRIQDNSHGRKD
jgi:hypothetical protein